MMHSMRFGLPLCSAWNAVGDESSRHGTMPDDVVGTRTADLLHGVDTQSELALKLARDSNPAAAAEPPGQD